MHVFNKLPRLSMIITCMYIYVAKTTRRLNLDRQAFSLSPSSILHRAVQRQDMATVTHLIRLGADPLLRNTFNSSSAQMLALKCFPPSRFSDKQEEKGTNRNFSNLEQIV